MSISCAKTILSLNAWPQSLISRKNCSLSPKTKALLTKIGINYSELLPMTYDQFASYRNMDPYQAEMYKSLTQRIKNKLAIVQELYERFRIEKPISGKQIKSTIKSTKSTSNIFFRSSPKSRDNKSWTSTGNSMKSISSKGKIDNSFLHKKKSTSKTPKMVSPYSCETIVVTRRCSANQTLRKTSISSSNIVKPNRAMSNNKVSDYISK